MYGNSTCTCEHGQVGVVDRKHAMMLVSHNQWTTFTYLSRSCAHEQKANCQL